MKILMDSCVWGGALQMLQDYGYNVVWTGSWPKDPGDDEILSFAHKEGRVLITIDKDFGELAVVFGRPHSGIIRLVKIPARQQAMVSHKVLQSHSEELLAGAIITVETNRLRIRNP